MSTPLVTKKVPTEHEEQAVVIEWAQLLSEDTPIPQRHLFRHFNPSVAQYMPDRGVIVELQLLFAIPNFAGRLGKATARHGAYLKQEGRRRGVPDLCWPIREHTLALYTRPAAVGLYVEMKRVKGGSVTTEQKWWHQHLKLQGYRVEVCRGAVEAIPLLWEYAGLAPPHPLGNPVPLTTTSNLRMPRTP